MADLESEVNDEFELWRNNRGAGGSGDGDGGSSGGSGDGGVESVGEYGYNKTGGLGTGLDIDLSGLMVGRGGGGKRKARCVSISDRAWAGLAELAAEFGGAMVDGSVGSSGDGGSKSRGRSSISGLIENIGLRVLKIR